MRAIPPVVCVAQRFHRNVEGGRVPPLQGLGDCFGASSQGVALGYRVVAPLARGTTAMRRSIQFR
jgi:hypothetical protein